MMADLFTSAKFCRRSRHWSHEYVFDVYFMHGILLQVTLFWYHEAHSFCNLFMQLSYVVYHYAISFIIFFC